MKSIYLCAKAGTGKSSCAEYLVKKGYRQASFAYPVYGLAYDYFDMSRQVKDRKLLQIIGTDVGRAKDNDVWVKRFLFDIEIVKETRKLLGLPEACFINADTRFLNEHKALQKEGWLGVYLDVDDDIRIKRLQSRDKTAQIETLNHISETALDEFKHELIQVDASGSLQKMFDNLEKAISAPLCIKDVDDWHYYKDALEKDKR